MSNLLITEDLYYFLKTKEFLYIATSNRNGQPYVAPKFLVKVKGDHIYLADFVVGRTCENLKNNSKVSLSIINLDDLMGYQMNGSARIIDDITEFDGIMKDLDQRKLHFSVERVIAGVREGKKHGNFEILFPAKLVVIKIEIEEIVSIAPSGKVERRLSGEG